MFDATTVSVSCTVEGIELNGAMVFCCEEFLRRGGGGGGCDGFGGMLRGVVGTD